MNRSRARSFVALVFTAGAAVAAVTTGGCDARRPEPVETSLLDAAIARPAAGDRGRALALRDAAHAAFAAGRVGDARDAFEQAVAADPACVEVRVEYGFLLLEQLEVCDYGGALEQFRAARVLEPEQLLAACGEGLARQELGDVERAEPLLRAAVAAGVVKEPPTRVAVVTAALARIDAIHGRTEAALQAYADAASVPGVAPRGRAIHLALRADLLEQADRPAEAESAARAALAADPELLRAHLLLSRLLALRGAAAEAAREARIHELLRALTDHRSRRAMEDVERRVRLRRELIAEWPEYARGPYQLIDELLAGGRFADASREIAALVRRDGLTLELHGCAARARAGAGDLAGAKASVDAMCRSGHEVPHAFVRRVLEDWKRGNPDVTRAHVDAKFDEWLRH